MPTLSSDVFAVPSPDAGTALRALTRRQLARVAALAFGAALGAIGCAAESSPAPGAAVDADAAVEANAAVEADAAASTDAAGDAAVLDQGAGSADSARGIDTAALIDSGAGSDTAAETDTAAATDTPPAPDTAPESDATDSADAAEDSDSPPVDVAPAAPDPAPLGPPVPAQVELLWAQQPSFAAPGAGEVIIAQAGTETVSLATAGLPPTQLIGDPGPARSLAVMPGPQLLLATDKGLYGLQGKKWGVSPVQALIGGPPRWLLVQNGQGGPWLWLGQPPAAGQVAALWRHDGQVLQPVAVPDLDLTASLADGRYWSDGPGVAVGPSGAPSPGGEPKPALWLHAAGQLRALLASGKSVQVWADHPLPAGKRLAGDGAGRLWWLASDGTLHQRDPADGAWQWLALPEAVTELAARSDVPYSALASAGGLWLQQQGVFFPVEGTAGLQLRGLSATGAIIAVGKQGLLRVTPGVPAPPPPPSWASDIQPLHNARCGTCHGPAAVTVKLHTAALWQQWFVKIQKQLATDAMPLVGTKLSAADKALVKAWGAGGFQP